jgi:Tol biopolymer transport system component
MIMFSMREPGKPWKMHLLSADGDNLGEIIPGEGSERESVWSPNGKSLLFGGDPPGRVKAVYLLDLSRRKIVTLPGSRGHYAPRWSPDGLYIATQKGDAGHLMMFDFATRKWRASPETLVGTETWSRGGKSRYFSGLGADWAALLVGIGDRELERAVSFKGLHNAGWWVGLARRVLFWYRPISGFKIYTPLT